MDSKLALKVKRYAKKNYRVVNKITLIKAVRSMNLLRDNPDNTTSLSGSLHWVEERFYNNGDLRG